MDNSVKYDSSIVTLADITRVQGIPDIVRVCADDNGKDKIGYRYYSRIKKGTELYLQNIQNVKYAHIKVLPFYDNSKAQKEMGAEYVMEHETFVGEEYLIPAKYREKVKFVHRPGSWRRFATVSQVLEASPRFVKAGENTKALNAKNLQEVLTIPAGSILELIREFESPEDSETYLECKDQNTSYALNTEDIVNFTEVDDPKQYNLMELVRFKMLPKVIMFEKVVLQDAILVDKELGSGMMTSLEGPVELLGFVDVEHLVTWVRDKSQKVYRLVLIPMGTWYTITIQKRNFLDVVSKNAYIKRKFGLCETSEFIKNYMYWLPLDLSQVTWLRNPEYSTESKTVDRLYDHVVIDFPVSSDEEEAGVYEVVSEPEDAADDDDDEPPLIHARVKLGHQKRGTLKDDKSVWQKIKKKKIHFKDVHKELLNFFHKKVKPKDEHTDQPPARPPKPHALQRSLSDRLPRNTGYIDTIGVTLSPLNEHTYLSKSSEVDEDTGQRNSNTYDYPDFATMTDAFKFGHESLTNECKKINLDRPLPAIPIVDPNDTESKNKNHESESLTIGQTEHMSQENQTEAEFFKYSVSEVENCFRSYGLQDFARLCHEERLDGNFFRHFDLQVLTTEPFNLSKFQVKKVKKLIYEGWRPKVRKESCETDA